jgi:hypothetical protein
LTPDRRRVVERHLRQGDLVDKIIAAFLDKTRKSKRLKCYSTEIKVIKLAAVVHRSPGFSFPADRWRGTIGAIKFREIGG